MVASLRLRPGSPFGPLRRAAATLVAVLSCASPSGSTPAGSPPEPGAGRSWYMAPDARCGDGKGTLEKPWCIQEALGSEKVKPGDTIYARLGGNYRLAEDKGSFQPIHATLRGEPDRRITVRPYAADQATPTTLIRVACDQGEQKKAAPCMLIESNWVDYHDFEVAYFGNPRRHAIEGERDLPGFGTGVRIMAGSRKSGGSGNRLINWVVHDTANNVFKADLANPIEFYGTVQYNYGFLYDTPKVKRVGGHAFYLRNGVEAKGRAKGCGSGTDDSEPGPSSLIDNIVSGSIRAEGFGGASMAYQDYGSCSCVMHRNEIFDGNFFLGGTLSGGCPRTNDFTLGTRDQKLTNNWWGGYTIGYNASGCDAVTIEGNYMFRPMYSEIDKYYKNRSAIFFAQRHGENVNPCRSRVTFRNNTYWGNANLGEGGGKSDDEVNGFKASWYSGNGNVYLPNDRPPDRNFTAVRPNRYRPGSCNVYVANFLDAASVPVDLSGCGLADGARYEIRSIYDYMGKPVGSGTFSAASARVEFPMTPAANPISDSVGHRKGGAPGSYPDMVHSVTKPGGNIFRNAFVVLTTAAPEPAAKP